MSNQDTTRSERKVKTLAIRLDTELHAQLSVIAQLRGNTITDEIREALSAHVAAQAASTDLAGSANEMLEEIEREADARRAALSTLFEAPSDTATKATRRSSTGHKPTSGDTTAKS